MAFPRPLKRLAWYLLWFAIYFSYIMLYSLLEPLGRPHGSDEVEVVVQIRMDTAQSIEEAALLAVFALPTSFQPLSLNAVSDHTLGPSAALPARGRTAKLLDLM